MAVKSNSLLKGAKKVAATTAAKKDDKKTHILSKELADELRQKIVIQKVSALLEGLDKDSSSLLKKHGEGIFVESVLKTGLAPESFLLSAEKDAKSTRLAELKETIAAIVAEVADIDDCGILYGMMDKYITIDEAQVDRLIAIFGEKSVDTKNEFTINAALVDEHGSKLMDFILGLKDASTNLFNDAEEQALAAKKKYDMKKKVAAFDKVIEEIEKVKRDQIKSIQDNTAFSDDEKTALILMIDPKFTDDVKQNLIQLKQKFSVAKGTINRLPELMKIANDNCDVEDDKWTIEKMVSEFKPIPYLKARGKSDK